MMWCLFEGGVCGGRFDSWLILRLIFGGKTSDSGYKEHNEKTQGYFYTKPVFQ